MKTKGTRPASVVIAQVLMIIFTLIFGFFASLYLVLFMPRASELSISMIFAGVMAYFLVQSSLFIAAFVGMARRRHYGRWIGVVMLSMAVPCGILIQVRQFSEIWKWYEFGVAIEYLASDIAMFIVGCLLIGLLIWVVVLLIFSDRVNAFFTKLL